MAQAGPMTDLTQRLFGELKSKNEEARVRAAYELYDNVLSVSRGTSPTCLVVTAIVKAQLIPLSADRLAIREVRRVLQRRQPTYRPASRHRK